MLGKSNIKFQRQYFVKDLYDPVGFLNIFDIVEFEDVATFVRCTNRNYYRPRGELIVHIHSLDDFDNMKKVMSNTAITQQCSLSLYIHEKDCFKHISSVAEKRFSIIIDKGTETKWTDSKDLLKYGQSNPIFMRATVSFDNIDTIFEEIISWYMKGITRFFELDIDYCSFEQATFADLHRIYFRFNRFVSWRGVTSDVKKGFKMELKIQPDQFNKRIFVDQEFNLYYNKRHHREEKEPSLFRLQRDKTGEDIPYKELNRIRQYADMTRDMMMNSSRQNLNWVDCYQNVLIQGVPNQMPVMGELVHRWLVL